VFAFLDDFPHFAGCKHRVRTDVVDMESRSQPVYEELPEGSSSIWPTNVNSEAGTPSPASQTIPTKIVRIVLLVIVAVAIVAQFNGIKLFSRTTPKVGNCLRGQVATGQFEARSIACDSKATDGVAVVRLTKEVDNPAAGPFSAMGLGAYLITEVCDPGAIVSLLEESNPTDRSAETVERIKNRGALSIAGSFNKTTWFCFERVDPE
jgi:hypothetical protein